MNILYFALVLSRGKGQVYSGLVDAVIKAQWGKLAAIESRWVEHRLLEIMRTLNPHAEIPFDPLAQMQHAKALLDFVTHLKASLDSIAVFLNDYLELGKKGGDRDFNKLQFIDAIKKNNDKVGNYLSVRQKWLDKKSNSVESIVAVRDEWVHRDSPPILAIYPPHEQLGCLPVPKKISGFPDVNITIIPKNFWSTKEFTDYHLKQVMELITFIVEICIEKEVAGNPVKLDNEQGLVKSSFFPMRYTGKTERFEIPLVRYLERRPENFSIHELIETPSQRVGRVLPKYWLDVFHELAKSRLINASCQSDIFVINDVSFHDLTREQIAELHSHGIFVPCILNIEKGGVIYHDRNGFEMTWQNNETKTVPVLRFSLFGGAISEAVMWDNADDLIAKVIAYLNRQHMDVNRLLITKIDNSGLVYDVISYHKFSSP